MPDTFDRSLDLDALHLAENVACDWQCIGTFRLVYATSEDMAGIDGALVKIARLEFRRSHSPLMHELPTAP
jgi:hypothetical protein